MEQYGCAEGLNICPGVCKMKNDMVDIGPLVDCAASLPLLYHCQANQGWVDAPAFSMVRGSQLMYGTLEKYEYAEG